VVLEGLGAGFMPCRKRRFPFFVVHGAAGGEDRRIFVKLKLVTRVKTEFLPKPQRNCDLAFGCNRGFHYSNVRKSGKNSKGFPNIAGRLLDFPAARGKAVGGADCERVLGVGGGEENGRVVSDYAQYVEFQRDNIQDIAFMWVSSFWKINR